MASDSRGAPMIAKVFHELRVQYSGRNPVRGAPAMLNALFRIGEEVISVDRASGMMELPPRSMIGFLIYDVLKQWEVKEAGQHLIEASKKDGSPAFLADVYVSRGEELGIFGDPPREEACISKEDFDTLGQILMEKISISYEDGTLSDAPFYFNIVRCWVHLSDGEAAKAWLTQGIVESGEFMAKVGSGLLAYSIDENGRHYSMESRPDPTLYQLDVLVDAGEKHCSDSKLTEDERQRVFAVVVGAKRLLEAKNRGGTSAEER